MLHLTQMLKHCNHFQTLLKEVGDWRRQEEANNCLRRRFEESRHELERVLKKAQDCLRETGEPEKLLKKHTVGSNISLKKGPQYWNFFFCILNVFFYFFYVVGIFWTAGPASPKCVLEGMR